MCRYLINSLLLLSYFALTISRPLKRQEKYYLYEKIAEWNDAPKAENIVKGTVTVDSEGTKKYKFVYEAENYSKCDANLVLTKKGEGSYGWECWPEKSKRKFNYQSSSEEASSASEEESSASVEESSSWSHESSASSFSSSSSSASSSSSSSSSSSFGEPYDFTARKGNLPRLDNKKFNVKGSGTIVPHKKSK